MIDTLTLLTRRLREAGIATSTSELIDASQAMVNLDLQDRVVVRECLRAALVKEPDPQGIFDRCFRATFLEPAEPRQADAPPNASVAPPIPDQNAPSPPMDHAVLDALMSGDRSELAALAERAVGQFGGDDDEASERRMMHRVLRALDLSRMLSAAMQQVRRELGDDELEILLRRSELSELIEQFRRELAAEIARRVDGRDQQESAADLPERMMADDVDLLRLSRRDEEELRKLLQPLLRRIAAKISQKRRLHSAGKIELRRTLRRSLQWGGVPLEVVTRRRYPHRPDVVVLCDVSGSVADFAQFTFSLINALTAEIRRVRSFAFVDGVAEVSDVFQEARYDVAVNRLIERRGVVGLDGHSDYGAVFNQFAAEFLEEAVGNDTTVIISGDARSNYRDGGVPAFAQIASRARRVYWLNPEPRELWDSTDSIIDEYRPSCTAVSEVRTLRQLADAIADLV